MIGTKENCDMTEEGYSLRFSEVDPYIGYSTVLLQK
jgi:hypothetical protein